jgi:SAM-dependent methyltransferase
MTMLDQRNADQAASWNGEAGRRWVERQVFMDRMLAPIAEALFAITELAPGLSAIDVGCGSGATTLKIAELVSPGGHVTGIDISAPLLALARQRAPQGVAVDFVEADAMVHPFAPGAADLVFSRFGVMFFADPTLAFSNMRKGLRRGGQLRFACWRSLRLNQWLSVQMEAVRPLLPPSPPTDPNAPGPYAFADDQRVKDMLRAAGFNAVVVDGADLVLDVAGGEGLQAAVTQALQIGPTARALADEPEAVKTAAADAIRNALAPFEYKGQVPLGAAVWLVSATSP